MGFYLRKSIKVGPLRFNLSKSGVGVSAGVRGLRFGTGPRGNYIHMGVGGLYYRKTVPPAASHPTPPRPSPSPNIQPPIPSQTHDPLTEIESGDVSQMVDSSSLELLKELNEKLKKQAIAPIAAIAGVIIVFLSLTSQLPGWVTFLLFILSAIGVFLARKKDELNKSVVMFYDFDEEMERAYDMLHTSAERLTACAGVWHIEAAGAVRDSKYHGGASGLVSRKKTSIVKAAPPFVKSNISTVAIGVGRQTLYLFPDRILVYDKGRVGAVGYSELRLEMSQTQFIESASGVPSDAKVVDYTWQYVNKKGGPDKRFKNNPRLPVSLYEQIHLRSESGLNELVQLSKTGVCERLAKAIKLLAAKLACA